MDLEFSVLKNRLQERMAADNISDADVKGWNLSDMTKVGICYALTTLPCFYGTCLHGRPGADSLDGIATACQLCSSTSHVWALAALPAAAPAATAGNCRQELARRHERRQEHLQC